MEAKERNYRDVLEEALKDVKQELVILVDGEPFLAYIHELTYKDGQVHIDWSTPHSEEEIMKDELFKHVQAAIQAQITEGKECQSNNLFSRISLFLRNTFAKSSHS
ncbi:gp40 head vertex assembly chaperone [Aeromonas phage Aeh1]|uniref:Gp40 head vertex assembly chaperone n=1 Tax=Aeromonas phage Aeh1 TaxID=2880362 RepID=Q76Z77_9CAUD|nr:head vertex assembly chaperone [Aeromonas phage Aeh1]AAQ17669.1 gp40 head vertex assembly chaperone [Aeromonas phage Aeh1]